MNEDSCTMLANMKKQLEEFEHFFFLECENTHDILSLTQKLKVAIDLKLKNDCAHVYVEDEIDLSPEKSKKITYCEKCMSCFSGKPGSS